ncbi:hypothetical protein VDGL01_02003 [Verticillium dahliae]
MTNCPPCYLSITSTHCPSPQQRRANGHKAPHGKTTRTRSMRCFVEASPPIRCKAWTPTLPTRDYFPTTSDRRHDWKMSSDH